ncbi:MAG: hypothetical protein H7Z11_20980 [Verrucomicrobia bacterium]|nr:hypothetical protein [Leptolyngbya sp. ES-bin-22]
MNLECGFSFSALVGAIAKRWLVTSVYAQVVARAFCEDGGVGSSEASDQGILWKPMPTWMK